MKKVLKSRLFWILVFGIPLVIALIGYFFPNPVFPSKEAIRNFVQSFGIWTPIIFVGLTIIPVVITPLSYTIFGIAAGFIFGIPAGFFLGWIAKVTGTMISFYIARKFGRGLVARWVPAEELAKYDRLLSSRGGLAVIFLIYFIPFLSNDNLSYLAGLSSLRARTFIPLVLAGHIGTTFSLAYIGNGASLTDPVFIAIIALAAVLAGVFLFLRRNHTR